MPTEKKTPSQRFGGLFNSAIAKSGTVTKPIAVSFAPHAAATSIPSAAPSRHVMIELSSNKFNPQANRSKTAISL